MKLLIAVSAVLLAGCSQPVAVTPEPVGKAKVELVSLNCDTNKTFGLVSGVIRNSGDVPLEFLNVFLRVQGQMVSAPALTLKMPVGALSEFDYPYGSTTPPTDCAVVSVQDQQGSPLL